MALAPAILSQLLWGRSHSPADQVRMLQSDNRNLVIEFRPVYSSPRTIVIDGTPFLQYGFEGGREDDHASPGGPLLQSLVVPLQLPSINHNTVEVVSADYEDVPQTLLAPVPSWQEGEVDPEPIYKVDPSLYDAREFSGLARLSNIGATQGIILGDLCLSPVQYNPRLRIARKYSRIVVRVSFGEDFKNAGTPSSLVRGVALNADAFPSVPSRSSSLPVQNSVLSAGTWYRFPVSEEGIYKLTGEELLNAGIPPSTDPSTIKIYGNGGFETPMAATDPFVDDLLENAVMVNDGGTPGQLDPGDEILVYCKSTRGWSYNPGTKTFSHYINRFAETNYYWLTYGGMPGKRMTQVPASPGPALFRPQTVSGRIFREDDKVNLISSGVEWLGQPFNVGDQITYVHQLNALDVTQPVSYKFRVGARSSGYSTFTFEEHGTTLTSVGLPGTDFGTYDNKLSAATVVTSRIPDYADNRSQLRFSFTSTSNSSNGYIDWYELTFSRFLRASSDQFDFYSYDTAVDARYDVSGFTGGGSMVFDVSKFDSVVQLVNPRVSGDTCSFALTGGTARHIIVAAAGGVKSPTGLTRIPNQNLHGDSAETAFVIITHPDFLSAAQRLKQHREQPGNYLSTKVVDVRQIYNEFGGGMLSPAAIRNYLRYLNDHWQTPPRYVLLFGDGHFDYKNISIATTNWIPPWETQESFRPLSSYSADDDYVIFNAGNRVGMGIGRLTPRSPGDANTIVDKIIEYENSSVVDPWRVRLTYVADDGPAGAGERNNLFIHTNDAEQISQLAPALFEKRKIYLYDFPTVYTSAGRRKPDVNTAIVNQMNQGTVVLNFNGHGNPRVWTHEQVFVRETDFANLSNRGKYFFLIAATCNYSHFDMLNDQSGGEILVGMPNAGAIAIFSATRPVFQGANFVLNSALVGRIFQTGAAGNVVSVRLGDAMYYIKQIYNGENDRKFFLLGDPTLRLAFPKKFASVDSLNHLPLSQIVQLQALSTATVSASVHDSTLSAIADFSGTSQLAVYDANRSVQFEDSLLLGNTWYKETFSYAATGNTLFRGEQTVTNGHMTASFVVPKDISYGNDFGRMTLYLWNASGDGAGSTTNFRVGGTDTSVANDQQGPKIQLYLDSRGFRSGDVVNALPVLIADLFDSNGINTSGAGVGHRLEAWLDDRAQSIDLSDYYKGKTDTYREGTIQYSLGALPQGTHKLRLRAWDTYNNSSTEQTVFEVITNAGLSLSNVYNFPNPVQSVTEFTFEQNQLTTIDVEVKIYTVAGRLIQSLKQTGVSDAFVRVPWDGRDMDGDLPANGVYLYKIIAKTQDSRYTSEALGKLSILR